MPEIIMFRVLSTFAVTCSGVNGAGAVAALAGFFLSFWRAMICATRSLLDAGRSSAAVKVTMGSTKRERLAGDASPSSAVCTSFEDFGDLVVVFQGRH